MKYVVTGSSSGLGYSLARKLLKKGDVIGLSRRDQNIIIKDCTGHKYSHIHADLSVPNIFSENSNLTKSVKKHLRDHEFTLILNAGVFYSGYQRLSGDERNRLFCVNLFSIMDLVNQVQKMNMKRIFFINSISGLIGQKTQHEYASSKHGLMGYIRSLINEAKDKPYDIMAINPGGIRTELWSEYPSIDTNDFLNPDELSDVIVSLITVKQRLFIPSFTILPPSDL
jgi:3-oxoacyl-[acyl-carrier protein] reductase